MADEIQVRFGADISGLTAGSQQAAQAVQQAGAAMSQAAATGAKPLSAAVDAAAASVKGLSGAAAGVSGASAEVASAMQAQSAAAGGVVAANEAVRHSSTAVRRELIVLSAEMARGNYSRLAGSMLVLSERIGNIPPVAMAAAAGFAALGFAAYELISHLVETDAAIDRVDNELALMGRKAEVASGAARASIANVADTWNISTKAAAEYAAIIDRIPEATAGLRSNLTMMIQGLADASHQEGNKVAEGLEKAFSSIAGLEEFSRQNRLLDTGLEQTLEKAKQTGDVFGAQEAVYKRLSAALGEYQQKDKEWRQTNTLGNELAQGMTAEGGAPQQLIKPPPMALDLGDSKVSDQAQALESALAANRQYESESAKIVALTERQKALQEQMPEAIREGSAAVAQLKGEIAGIGQAIAAAQHKSVGGSQVEQWREQLQQQLIDENKFGKAALQAELGFWEGKKKAAAGSVADERAVTAEIYAIRSQLAAESTALDRKDTETKKQALAEWYRNYAEGMREQIDQAQGSLGEQRKLLQEWLATAQAIYGQDASKYRDALNEKLALDRQATEQQKRDLADWWENYSEGIRQQIALAQDNASEQMRLATEWIKAGERLYGEDVSKYRDAISQKMALSRQLAEQQKRDDERIASSAASTVMGMISGRESWRQAAARVADQVLEKELANVLQIGIAWARGELTKTAATLAGEQARNAAKVAGAAEGKAVDAATGSASVLGDANRAAAGAYAAVAGIPYVGPVLAPIAAGAAFAAVAAFDVFSAAGGWGEVPYDNAPAMLHKSEMVLPASLATPLRQVLTAPGAGWGMPALRPPSDGGGFSQGDFSPSIVQHNSFHGAPAGMSRSEFRRHLERSTGSMVEALHGAWRGAGRPAFR